VALNSAQLTAILAQLPTTIDTAAVAIAATKLEATRTELSAQLAAVATDAKASVFTAAQLQFMLAHLPPPIDLSVVTDAAANLTNLRATLTAQIAATAAPAAGPAIAPAVAPKVS